MVKFILTTPNIIGETEQRTIIMDPQQPTIDEVVIPEGETKKVWKIKGKQYSKKTGTEKQKNVGQGQHWEHAFKLSRIDQIIDESDTYYKTEHASNYLIRKDTLKHEVCKSHKDEDLKYFMETLNGTK